MYKGETFMNIKGAIFDLDGTLIDSLGFWKRLWEKLGEMYLNDTSFLPNLDMQKAVRTVTFVDASKMLYDAFGFGSGPDEIYHMMTEFCTEFYKKEAALKPGVKELLEHLKSKGIKMCVASASMPDLIRTIFDRFGLDNYIPKIISCADVGKDKSHPDVFIAAETYMGTSREDTWVFEDSFVALQTASKAGFQTVGVFDENNFDAAGIEAVSNEYIGVGDSFVRLLERIK
ncbi:MAG: HAD family phosphatase [Ruminococcaceae bacterium]|nr:HAD family phosphatase [Oscillospiraceae bacterium]